VLVNYVDNKLEKTCNSAKDLRRRYGDVCGKLIGQRLDQMKAASSLAVLRTLPQLRCHELTGDRKGQLAVDVKQPYRLVFRPNPIHVLTRDDGGLDWTSVTDVTIIEIVDYHEH
jgi:plasmid maintenance system killer protein